MRGSRSVQSDVKTRQSYTVLSPTSEHSCAAWSVTNQIWTPKVLVLRCNQDHAHTLVQLGESQVVSSLIAAQAEISGV